MDDDRKPSEIHRRDFLRGGVLAGAFALTRYLPQSASSRARLPGRRVLLAADPRDPIASAPPVRWAVSELLQTMSDAGFAVQRRNRVSQMEETGPDDLFILVAGSNTPAAAAALEQARAVIGEGPERFAIVGGKTAGHDALHACGTDARGLTYAVLELADRVRIAPDTAFTLSSPIIERPTNIVRSVMRQFTSEVLDKPWFTDREMWQRYLTMLATHRFNRLHLAFGLGYDFLQNVNDSYAVFLYPFLLAVPGYTVRATNLPDAERDRNLEMLRFISEQTVARGLTFQLGIWMHGYELNRSPNARYLIEGLTPETHATYSRDALTALLKACPAISAVALRIHGESGVKEGSYDFWQAVFDGVKRCGRNVEIDLHAKGIDQTMIDRALATGMPVNVSPKYWAEHLGMPYHQTAIRDLEMPVAGKKGSELMALSEGARSFTRYGYADLLRDDRKYTVRHRVWAGTRRMLLSGDPEATAAYSRMFAFCGSAGFDVMEPLTFRGRRGTGLANTRRSGYIDEKLETTWDWEKFEYWYRVWGRLTYNADTDTKAVRQPQAFGAEALARASRILPIITTAHLPSAACDGYWPEVYWNQPLADEPKPNPYGDTPAPKTFLHVSPLDPQLFAGISDYADELLKNERSGKYSPIEVATWLEDLAAGVTQDLAKRKDNDKEKDKDAASSAATRLTVDALIQADLGRFFAAKFRAGVLFAIFERTGDRRAFDEAIASYRKARAAWAELCDRARPVYAADLSVSDKMSERGQWSDRLASIDEDIERLAQRPTAPSASAAAPAAAAPAPASNGAATSDAAAAKAAIAHALSRVQRPPVPATHAPPTKFQPKAALPLELSIARGRTMQTVACYYRHVNQGERYQRVEMQSASGASGAYRASIPADYTDSPFPLQYYFVLHENPTTVHLHPGLGASLMGLPYFVIRRDAT